VFQYAAVPCLQELVESNHVAAAHFLEFVLHLLRIVASDYAAVARSQELIRRC
jgi:hypothetical protein